MHAPNVIKCDHVAVRMGCGCNTAQIKQRNEGPAKCRALYGGRLPFLPFSLCQDWFSFCPPPLFPPPLAPLEENPLSHPSALLPASLRRHKDTDRICAMHSDSAIQQFRNQMYLYMMALASEQSNIHHAAALCCCGDWRISSCRPPSLTYCVHSKII